MIDDIVTGDNSIRERYRRGTVEFHVHIALRIGALDLDPTYHCVSFRFSPGQVKGERTRILVDQGRDFAPGPEGVERDDVQVATDQVQGTMFVDVGQNIQLPGWVGYEILPALVRLQPLYDCLRLWAHANDQLALTLKHRCALAGLSFPIFIPNDRELRVACHLFRYRISVPTGERKDEMVETATEILNGIPKDQRKRVCRNLVGTGFDQEIIRSVRIGFKPVGVMAAADPLTHGDIEIIQVLSRTQAIQPQEGQP